MDEGDGQNLAKQGAGDRTRCKLGGAHGVIGEEKDNRVEMESMGAGREQGRGVREEGGNTTIIHKEKNKIFLVIARAACVYQIDIGIKSQTCGRPAARPQE